MRWIRGAHAVTRATIVWLGSLLALTIAHAAPGDLDPTFGGSSGQVVVPVTGGGWATALVRQPDAKLVASGRAGPDVVLLRWNADGSLDRAFGAAGEVRLRMPAGSDGAVALVRQDDGKLVIAGSSHFMLARFHDDGTLDTDFAGGVVLTAVGSGNGAAEGVAVQPDGKLVAAGWTTNTSGASVFALARYRSDGSLDTSTFHETGKVTTAIRANARAQAIAVLPDGRLVAAGWAANAEQPAAFAVARYLPWGELDPSFGGGHVETSIGADDDVAFALAVQPDGRLIAGGYAAGGGTSEFAMVRYDPDGHLDRGFSGGTVTTPVSGRYDAVNAVLVQPDGRIVAAGVANSDGIPALAIARYEARGGLDRTFGRDGTVVVPMGGGGSAALALVLQPDRRLVTAGQVIDGRTASFGVARFLGDSICGDGMQEPDEECDLGPENGSPEVCCTATCLLRGAGEACRPATGACDLTEQCSGSAPECPGDGFRPPGALCRPQTGECDVADLCSGSDATCPDHVRAAGTPCGDDGLVCSVDVCDGERKDCSHPAGNRGITCRTAAGPCDVAETCDGVSLECPEDRVEASCLPCTASRSCDDGTPGVIPEVSVERVIPVPATVSPRAVRIPVTLRIAATPRRRGAKVVLRGILECDQLRTAIPECAGVLPAGNGYGARLQSRTIRVTRRKTRTLGKSRPPLQTVQLPLTRLGRRLFARLGYLPVAVTSTTRDRRGRTPGAIVNTLLVRQP
jgi:uncharacterized delta-60 repeat protein